MAEAHDRSSGWIGTVLHDKWRIDAKIARGGVATVYRATHRQGQVAAIKIMHPELARNEEVRKRFLREGYAANKVGHPGVVSVLDDDVTQDGSAYIVMELLDKGEVLEDRRERLGGRLPIVDAVDICQQVLDVLAVAHEKGIIHRDIKPENIFVLSDGTVKVLDFGIAHIKEAAKQQESTQTGLLLGTPEYMSPEQVLGKRGQIDAATDIYAVGATLFTLLSGESVHVADTLNMLLVQAASRQARSLASVVYKELPKALIAVVDKALALEKPRRWASARAMQLALREVVPARPTAATATATATATTAPAATPSVPSAPIAKPSEAKAPIAKPSASRAPIAMPSASRTPIAKPSESKAPIAMPSASRTPIAKPSASRAPIAKPSESRAPIAKPSEPKAPDAKPSEPKAPDAKPSEPKAQLSAPPPRTASMPPPPRTASMPPPPRTASIPPPRTASIPPPRTASMPPPPRTASMPPPPRTASMPPPPRTASMQPAPSRASIKAPPIAPSEPIEGPASAATLATAPPTMPGARPESVPPPPSHAPLSGPTTVIPMRAEGDPWTDELGADDLDGPTVATTGPIGGVPSPSVRSEVLARSVMAAAPPSAPSPPSLPPESNESTLLLRTDERQALVQAHGRTQNLEEVARSVNASAPPPPPPPRSATVPSYIPAPPPRDASGRSIAPPAVPPPQWTPPRGKIMPMINEPWPPQPVRRPPLSPLLIIAIGVAALIIGALWIGSCVLLRSS